MADKIELDLSKYGGKGTVILSEPGLRRARAIENRVLARTRVYDDAGNMHYISENLADVPIIRVLGYIESAPFDTDIERFIDYTEVLDNERSGAGTELLKDLIEAVNKINGGETSVFQS